MHELPIAGRQLVTLPFTVFRQFIRHAGVSCETVPPPGLEPGRAEAPDPSSQWIYQFSYGGVHDEVFKQQPHDAMKSSYHTSYSLSTGVTDGTRTRNRLDHNQGLYR